MTLCDVWSANTTKSAEVTADRCGRLRRSYSDRCGRLRRSYSDRHGRLRRSYSDRHGRLGKKTRTTPTSLSGISFWKKWFTRVQTISTFQNLNNFVFCFFGFKIMYYFIIFYGLTWQGNHKDLVMWNAYLSIWTRVG
jgi:hypothetical protein